MFRFGDPGGRSYNTPGTGYVNLLAWWNGGFNNLGGVYFTVPSGAGRTGGNCLRLSWGGDQNATYISKPLTSRAAWGIAFAIKPSTFTGVSTILFSLYDTATSQVDLRLNSGGTFRVTRGGTVLGNTTVGIPVNVWSHVEWKSVIDNTVGTTEVRINGQSAGLVLTGQNTRASANSSANIIFLGNVANVGQGWPQTDLDDIIVYDDQVNDAAGNPDIHDWVGDCGLTWLLPSGAGTTTQFTPDSGSNYARVNEATPDGDTSYVIDSTIGHLDTYAITNLPGTIATVKSLAVVNYARKDDVGTRSFAPEIRTNSANFDGVTQSLGNSYLYYFSNWGQNPSGTPANWTPTDVNNLEAGQKVLG